MVESIIFQPIEQSQFPLWKQMRAELYRALDDGFHDKEMAAIQRNDDWICRFIVNEAGQIIGLLELSSRNIVDGCLTSPVAYLEGLYLKPAYRGQGYGTTALKKVVNWCRENGYAELATDTELQNDHARIFYEAFGFEETDRIIEYRMKINGDGTFSGSRI